MMHRCSKSREVGQEEKNRAESQDLECVGDIASYKLNFKRVLANMLYLIKASIA